MTWDRRSPAEQRRVADQVLARWLGDVAAYSPFWRGHLARAQLAPDAVSSLDRLAAVPAVRELDVVDAGGPGAPALVLRPTAEQLTARAGLGDLLALARQRRTDGAARVLRTDYKPIHLHRAGRDGGLVVASTRSDLDRLHRAGARAAAVLSLSEADYVVSAVPVGPTASFWAVYHLALGASILAVHARRAGEDLAVVGRSTGLLPVTAVAVPVDEAAELAAALAGADVSGVATVVTVGPPPGARRRAAIADAWRAAGAPADLRVLALWAPAEARMLWAECAASAHGATRTGLHTYPDLGVVELVDAVSGEPTRSGGDLTITTAGWHGTSLVRYRTGDHCTSIATEPCPACGRTVPRVLGPVLPGAWQPLLAGGGRVDLRGAAAVVAAYPAVTDWRVELRPATTTDGAEGYVAEVAGELDDEMVADLHQRLALSAGLAPRAVVVADADTVRAQVEEDGAPLVDAR